MKKHNNHLEKTPELKKFLILQERGYVYKDGQIYQNGESRGSKDNEGYITLRTKYKGKVLLVRAHRYIWFLHYGEPKKEVIDHIDRNRSNNRIENLRESTHQENLWNSKSLGYHYYKKAKKWTAYIHINKKRKHLGCYDTKEQAIESRKEALKIYYTIK